jgi:uncharacterized membrane protein
MTTDTTSPPSPERVADAEVDARDRPAARPSATGLDPRVAGALAYLFGALTGVVLLLVEREDEYVRYHAAQSTVVFGGLFVLAVLTSLVSGLLTTALAVGNAGLLLALVSPVVGLVWLVLGLGALGLWLYLMLRAYRGDRVRLPVATDLAARLV